MSLDVNERELISLEKMEGKNPDSRTDPFERPAVEVVRYTMRRPLRSVPGDLPLPFGYRLESWCDPLLPAYGAAMAVAFSDSPDIRVYPRLESGEGCVSLVTELAAMPEFIPAATWLLFFNREPCGLILTSRAKEPKVGQIRVVGVAPRHRAVGVGALLVNKGLWAFRDRRHQSAIVKVNRENRQIVRFFRGLGFHVDSVQEYL